MHFQNWNGVLNRLVPCLKCMKLACWVFQASLDLHYYLRCNYLWCNLSRPSGRPRSENDDEELCFLRKFGFTYHTSCKKKFSENFSTWKLWHTSSFSLKIFDFKTNFLKKFPEAPVRSLRSKEAEWSRSRILKLKKFKYLEIMQTSNWAFMSYGHFPAKNGSNPVPCWLILISMQWLLNR